MLLYYPNARWKLFLHLLILDNNTRTFSAVLPVQSTIISSRAFDFSYLSIPFYQHNAVWVFLIGFLLVVWAEINSFNKLSFHKSLITFMYPFSYLAKPDLVASWNKWMLISIRKKWNTERKYMLSPTTYYGHTYTTVFRSQSNHQDIKWRN